MKLYLAEATQMIFVRRMNCCFWPSLIIKRDTRLLFYSLLISLSGWTATSVVISFLHCKPVGSRGGSSPTDKGNKIVFNIYKKWSVCQMLNLALKDYSQ